MLSLTSSSLVSISFSFSSYWSNYTAVLMRFPFYWHKIPTCDPNIIPRRLLTSNLSFLVFIMSVVFRKHATCIHSSQRMQNRSHIVPRKDQIMPSTTTFPTPAIWQDGDKKYLAYKNYILLISKS